jgi:hypothetical protein
MSKRNPVRPCKRRQRSVSETLLSRLVHQVVTLKDSDRIETQNSQETLLRLGSGHENDACQDRHKEGVQQKDGTDEAIEQD